MSLFQMSVAGGVLILFIVVIRALAIHRLPKITFLVLWLIAASRLLLPFSIPMPFDTHIGLDVFSGVVQELPAGNIGSPLLENHLPSFDTDSTVPSLATEHISVFKILWLVGVLLSALYFSISYFRSMRKFRTSIPDNTPYIRGWLTAHQIIRPIEVRSSDLISSPLTYGILHPVILLPKNLDRNDQTALEYILTHEYVHIRRFDALTKILFAAVLCIHWFNPLTWVMYVLANRDMELLCDAWVIRMMGAKNRSSYALMLIKMEERKSGMSALYSHFGKNAISERIEAIMKFKKTSVLACTLAFALIIGATTAFAASSGGWHEFDLDDLNLTEGRTGTETDKMKIVDSESIPDQVKDLDQFDLTEGQVGTESNGMKIIDPSDTHGQIVDTDDLNLVEGNVGTESNNMKIFEYTPEEWSDIQQKIDNGELAWQQ